MAELTALCTDALNRRLNILMDERNKLLPGRPSKEVSYETTSTGHLQNLAGCWLPTIVEQLVALE